jgi:hypothetical protein
VTHNCVENQILFLRHNKRYLVSESIGTNINAGLGERRNHLFAIELKLASPTRNLRLNPGFTHDLLISFVILTLVEGVMVVNKAARPLRSPWSEGVGPKENAALCQASACPRRSSPPPHLPALTVTHTQHILM